MADQKSTLQVSRDAALLLMIVGAINWGVTAARMMSQKPFVWVPDLFAVLNLERSTVYNVQMFVYFLVAASGTFYTLSYTLVKCFPTIAS